VSKLKEGSAAYQIEDVPMRKIVALARARGFEAEDPSDDLIDSDDPEDYLDHDENLETETDIFADLEQAFTRVGGRRGARGEIKITKVKYAPGLYRNTDYEPQDSWTVHSDQLKSWRDLCKPKQEPTP
jgi:hypothetical protein